MPAMKTAPMKEPSLKALAAPAAPDLRPGIETAVLSRLGRPRNLRNVIVKHLWDNRYRVNVWCEVPCMFTDKMNRITDSFFVSVNETGEIVNSSPALTLKYNEHNPEAVEAKYTGDYEARRRQGR